MSIDPPVVRAFARQLLDDSGALITAIVLFGQITDLPRQRPSLLQHVATQRTDWDRCPNSTQLILCARNPQGDYLPAADGSAIRSGDIIF
jgi:hypothetical protein